MTLRAPGTSAAPPPGGTIGANLGRTVAAFPVTITGEVRKARMRTEKARMRTETVGVRGPVTPAEPAESAETGYA